MSTKQKLKITILIPPVWILAIFLMFHDANVSQLPETSETIDLGTIEPHDDQVENADLSVEYSISPNWPVEILAIHERIFEHATNNGLDSDLVAAIIWKESWFSTEYWPQGFERCPAGPVTVSCTSVSGAIGVMQVMPFHFTEEEDPRDLETNISRGTRLFTDHASRMGSARSGLAAYNCGRYSSFPAECWEYADLILAKYEEVMGMPFLESN